MRDDSELIAPASVTVDHDYKPVLYLPDGRVLVRQAGFRGEVRHVVPAVSEAPRGMPRPGRASQGR